jgi:heme A synthase
MKRQRKNRKPRRQHATPTTRRGVGDVRPPQPRPHPAVPHAAGPWPFRLAIVLVCLTTLTIWLGALVTTFGAGMAAPDWPRSGGLDLIGLSGPFWILGTRDQLLDGSHRLLGALVGAVALALLIIVWRHDRRRWMRALLGGTLLMLMADVLLGVTRVWYDSAWSALLHAAAGVLLLSLFVTLAVAHAPTWCRSSSAARGGVRRGLVRLAIMTTFVTVVQVTLGTFVRHDPIAAGPATFRLLVICHLGIAGIVMAHIVLIAWRCFTRRRAETRPLRWATACLVAAAALQIVLGTGTWVTRFGWPTWLYDLPGVAGYTIVADGIFPTQLVAAHVANASLVLAATVWILAEAVGGYCEEGA